MGFTVSALMLGVGLLCFALRALPRIGKPLIGHDAWAILLVVDQLKQGGGYNGVSKYFLLPGEHDYPPVFFYFLSLFPLWLLRKYNWLINPIMDSVNASLLCLSGYILTGDILLGFIAGIVYSFTPVVLEESLILSTRIFGMVLFNATLLSFVLYQSTHNLLFMSFMVIGGILVLLSHKFASEVLLLLSVSFTILSWSILPALAFLAAVLGALIFSGGFYLKVLHGQLGINKFWLKHYKEYGSPVLGHRITDGSGRQIETGRQEQGSTLSIRRVWQQTKRANPIYWLLELNPFNPFALVALLLPLVGIRGSWEWTTFQWSVLTLVFYYAATHLRFLGHYPGRTQFLDYNAFPSALVCALFVWQQFSYWKLIVMGVAFLLSLVQNARGWTRIRERSRTDDQALLKDIFDYLKSSKKDGVICLPSSHTYAVPYFTGKKVFYTMSAQNYGKLAAFFPILTVPLKNLTQEYAINFVLVDRRAVPTDAIELPEFKQVMERNDYVLLEKTT
ncbi:MAG: hypothetical protein WB643_03830 [Candidatus Bathyarchaeia archaeon]